MMYDFTYRSPSAPTFRAFMPFKIEGAPDHGTIADAQVWAAHYDVRIDLLDGAGRVRRVVDSDGQVRDLKTVLFDSISPSGVEMATARALRESVERMGRVAEKMRVAGITREDATRLRDAWVGRWPAMQQWFARTSVMHPALQAHAERKMQEELDIAEARKRAWALGLDWQAEVDGAKETGESVATRVGRLWEIENTPSDDLAQLDQIYLSAPLCQRERAIATINARTQAPTCAQWVKFGEPRERSCYFIVRGADRAMSGKTAFLDDLAGLRRLQTDMRAFQVEQKQPKPARTRHLTGVSVDLLIAVGQIGGA